MVIYSIKDIEHLTGVKAHTIRIWEKRYDIICPQRTETNIRYYREEDLKKILNIALLNKHGYKISHIARMSEIEVNKLVAQISDFDEKLDDELDCLTISMMDLDEFKFNRILDTNICQLGFERTMNEVIFPFLDKIGQLWTSGCIRPVHEHFVSEVIKRKTNKAIDDIPINTDVNMPRFLIYLPKNENSELSLLYLHYHLKKQGVRVINLGKNIEQNMIVEACSISSPDFLVVMANEAFAEQPLTPFLNILCKNLPKTTILLTGYQAFAQSIQSTRKIKVLSGLDDILKFCNRVSQTN